MKEQKNLMIKNIGGSKAINAIAQFYDGDPDNGGTQINNNIKSNLQNITIMHTPQL